MSDGRKKDQTRGLLGKRERKGRCTRATPGVSDQDRPRDLELFENARDQFGLTRGRGVLVTIRTGTPAVAWTVNQNDAMRCCQFVTKCEPHILQIAAGAMD